MGVNKSEKGHIILFQGSGGINSTQYEAKFKYKNQKSIFLNSHTTLSYFDTQSADFDNITMGLGFWGYVQLILLGGSKQ